MNKSLLEYATENNLQYLLTEWDQGKNGNITPAQVAPRSHQKYWWRCSKGHEWDAPVYSRVAGKRCPYCTGRKVQKGYNDLATTHPEIAVSWHPTKNGDIKPTDVTAGSNNKYWWICDKGHEWEADVTTRTSGRNCPYCTNRLLLTGYNDLATTHPDIAASWHPSKNGDVKPTDVIAGSHDKYWWVCDKKHEWEAAVYSRAAGRYCPYCTGRKVLAGFNDLATVYPNVVKMWHPTKNGNRTPSNVLAGSSSKAWWICKLGHEWESWIHHVVNGSGCPICNGKQVLIGYNDLKTLDPEVAAQWHPELNGDLTPEMVAKSSNKYVWWQCDLGHAWKASINSRTGKVRPGCPYCTGRKALAGFNDLETLQPMLATQWFQELNGDLKPSDVTCGCNKKVWWQCEEGHIWDAVINSRAGAQHCGCPICTNSISKKKQERYKLIEQEVRLRILNREKAEELRKSKEKALEKL